MLLNRLIVIILGIGLLAFGGAVGCDSRQPTADSVSAPAVSLTLSAAASLQEALEAIAPRFEQAHPNVDLNFNFGASGALQRQIEQGAPVDLFFAAAAQPMEILAAKGLILPDSRRDIVSNRLVLIAPQTTALVITDLRQLSAARFSRLAVGEFRSVPAGQYAQQALAALNLLAPLQEKLVFGSNVRSVLTAVASGNAELGLVYATDAALSDRVQVLLTVPANLHTPIVYPIAIVSRCPHPAAAAQLIEFLQQDAAQAVFAEFGFGA